MSLTIFKCAGGEIVLPAKNLVLVDAQDGGNLIVNPPRKVWERSELHPIELVHWSFLVAATGKAMLQTLPQLKDGCINYWEAGNWALHKFSEPVGTFKTATKFRQAHLHLLGRNPQSKNKYLKWGEAPKFPKFVDRYIWTQENKRLSADECVNILRQVKLILLEIYGLRTNQIEKWSICPSCNYPIAEQNCDEC